MAALAFLGPVHRALGLREDDQANSPFVKKPGRRPLRPGLDSFRLFPQSH
jgi:hypothetical protein